MLLNPEGTLVSPFLNASPGHCRAIGFERQAMVVTQRARNHIPQAEGYRHPLTIINCQSLENSASLPSRRKLVRAF